VALNMWENNHNLMVPIYLMSSYLYYVEDISMLEDYDYDLLCKMLYDEFDNVEHMHKHLIDKDSLRAGTGFNISKDSYPELVKGAAWHLVKERGLI